MNEGFDFLEGVRYFYQYGPFAILLFLFFLHYWANKQLKSASKETKTILKGSIMFYKVLIVLLIGVCVFFWAVYLTGPTFFYGDITNLNPALQDIKSADLHLKKSVSGDCYIINWVWKKNKDENHAKIILEFAGKDGKINGSRYFYIHQEELERGKCTFEYNEEDGVLKYKGKPLDTGIKTAIDTNLKKKMPGAINLLYAGPIMGSPGERNIDSILTQLQALDPAIRNLEIENLTDSAPKKRDFIIRVLQRGFDILAGSNQEQPGQEGLLYNDNLLLTSLLTTLNNLPDRFFKDWDDLGKSLGIQATAKIIESVGNQDANIKNLAHEFYARLGEKNEKVEKILQSKNKNAVDIESSSYQVPENLKPKQTEVLNIALKLKEENLFYKWGGKSPGNGFDSPGFIAYTFNKAGLIEKPGEWHSSKMRAGLGTPRKGIKPSEPGDLLFYKRGYVMLYLGNNKIIGMTENGVIVTDYKKFHDGPFQVNEIDYQ